MAERLENFEFPRMNRGRRRYDWDSWTDGAVWKLVHGEDFDLSINDMRASCFNRATAVGMKCRTSSPEPCVLVVQFYKPETNEQGDEACN